MVWHHSLPLMNSFNKTEAAVFSCRLCFLRAFPFISFISSTTIVTDKIRFTNSGWNWTTDPRILCQEVYWQGLLLINWSVNQFAEIVFFVIRVLIELEKGILTCASESILRRKQWPFNGLKIIPWWTLVLERTSLTWCNLIGKLVDNNNLMNKIFN